MMAFKSLEELVEMVSQDPKMARMRVMRAKKAGIPIVSSSNSGYSNRSNRVYNRSASTGLSKTKSTSRYGAISRRIAAMQKSKSVATPRGKETPSPSAPTAADLTGKKQTNNPVVAKRKKVGY